ncbi:hypothetical protein Ccar_10960 [Clostridium carboxidivorans P7]|uniref:Uncharacterized protein n=1 Tax=Clostridium carboxidivorans P7 TaxID=536227 RepID=C6PUB5_9CLOT|nr:hypothetical protein [Clostridium carboxidivorans]AKN31344.1 hypothetical protein Ccar_10960 [Clostridium carboxidivorans P7]EET87213.1 hypothetical protein CcarbDRAFT_2382 [Clostridium carboxidivorans P7]
MSIKIDNMSQIMRYNALQNLSNMNEGLFSNSSEVLFSSMLDNMLKDNNSSVVKNRPKKSKVKDNGNAKSTDGLESLSLQPQQMARMMRISAEQSMISALNGNGIDSMYNGFLGLNSMMGGNNYTTLMFGYMLGRMSQNSHLATK